MNQNPILLPLDGSPYAEATLPWAELFARLEEREIVLFSAVETEFEGLLSERLNRDPLLEAARREAAERYLKRIESRLRETVRSVRTVTEVGPAADGVVGTAEKLHAGLIIMATHGRGGLDRWALGSVADKVMRLADCPTMLVRPTGREPAPQALVLNRILVPLDGSPESEIALEAATDIAKATGARLALLRVVPFLTTAMDWEGLYVNEIVEIESEMKQDARHALEECRKRVPPGIELSIQVLNGPAADGIEQFIKDGSIDLTVMTTHGRGGGARFVFGSTAERLVQAGYPVLLLHPARTHAQGESRVVSTTSR